VLAYTLVIPAALDSMHREWREAGLDENLAWVQVLREAQDWYWRSLAGLTATVLVCAAASRFVFDRGWGSVATTGLSVGAVLLALRLLKWHKEIDQ